MNGEFARSTHADKKDESRPARLRRSVAPMVVGHADDPAEHAADAVADAVIARLHAADLTDGDVHGGAPVTHDPGVRRSAAPRAGEAEVGYAGGALSGELSERIDRARAGGRALSGAVRARMEGPFGAGLGDLRIHDGNEAAALNRSLSASAFTSGRDIFFGAGQFRPDTPAGEHVLAHEIAHTRQAGTAVGRTVHRRLAGTADAMESLGGTKTSGGVRKLFKKLTNWDKILLGLREYEALEARLAGADLVAFTAAKPKMSKKLKNVESGVRSWRQANDEAGNEALAEQSHKQAKKWELAESDTRTKAGRRQAVGLLEPRLGNELNLLASADPAAWLNSLGLNPDTLARSGRTDAGQKNSVQEMKFRTEVGKFKGYFKEDVGFTAKPEVHELQSGIRQHDPRYGARTVAMYRLDKLFNANVTARAEFAIRKDEQGKTVLGTVLESAKGTQASKLTVGLNREHADQLGPGAVALDDPVFQRCLNKLQILDAIAGQLDRHGGNYYVQQDESGAVTGLTGIDLDMAFGGDMMTPDAIDAENYRALPPAIDQEMGEAILRVQPDDIEQALSGLLPAKEIAATVSRFRAVKAKVQEASDAGQLRGTWDARSAQERPKFKDYGFLSQRRSYADDVAASAKFDLKTQVTNLIQEVLQGRRPAPGGVRAGELTDLHPEQIEALEKAALGPVGPVEPIGAYLMDENIPANEIEGLVLSAIGAWLEPGRFATAIVQTQEAVGVSGMKTVFDDVLTRPFKDSAFGVVTARHAQRSRSRRRGMRIGSRR